MLRDSKPYFERISPMTRISSVGAVLLCGLLVVGLSGPAWQSRALAEGAVAAAEPTADSARPDDGKTEPSLVGGWRADSVSIAIDGGKVKTLTQQDGILSAVISEKTLTLRLGENVLAEMTYTLDTQAKPWTIDLQSKDGAMLGICARRADDLQISLNDQAEGRPKDFDRNHNGMVLYLRRFAGDRISVINADGTGLHVVTSMPDFTRLGSPDWSRDGSKIAFDGWQSIFGQDLHDAHIFTVNTDGSGLKDLGMGCMPSWSPDDKQLTYCQYGEANGVWVINADGSNPRLIDAQGWGSQWSPKSNEIAYAVYGGGPMNICIRDMATGTTRMLLTKSYRQIYWGFGWSPDGKWISFKASLDNGGSELAAVSTDGEAKGFKVLMSSSVPEISDLCTTTSWGGTGNQILLSMKKETDRKSQIYILDFASDKPPQLFPGLPADSSATDPAWSLDGQRVAIPLRPPVKPRQTTAAGGENRTGSILAK